MAIDSGNNQIAAVGRKKSEFFMAHILKNFSPTLRSSVMILSIMTGLYERFIWEG